MKMGMLGVYIMIDEKTLDGMMKLDGKGLFEKINELEETVEKYSIDKLYDGLHCLLTGVSASTPIENDKLSEAVVGVHVFDTNDDDYITCTENDELPEIIKALENVNIKELEEKFDPKILKKKKIYPNIWETDRKDELFKELINEYNGLLDFYKKAFEKNMHIIFSVF
jgi:hypothetical protein